MTMVSSRNSIAGEVRSGWRGLRRLGPLIRPFWGLSAAVVACGVVMTFLEGLGIGLFIPFVYAVSDGALEGDQQRWIVRWLAGLFDGVPAERRLAVIGGCILLAISGKAILGYGYGALFGWLDARLGHRLREGVFVRLLHVEYGFIEKSDHGELLNTLSTETYRTAEAIRVVLWSLGTLLTIGLLGAFLFALSWTLTLLAAASLGGIAALTRVLNRRVREIGEEITVVNERLAARMIEGLAAMQPMRAFGRERYERERFRAVSEHASQAGYRLGLVSGIVGPTYEVLTAAVLVGLLLLGVRSADDLPMLFVFLLVPQRLQPKVRGLDGARLGLIGLAPAVRRVTTLLRRPLPGRPGTRPFHALAEAIRFEDVEFAYDPAWASVLHRVSFSIPAGKTTAIVGPSGAGKSTVGKLLLRFYDPVDGQITADGTPLDDVEFESWREQLAFVSQDVYLFNDTVRANIAYGREGATDAEVEAAARHAQAHGFITGLPDGYDTPLGERGTRLSGGQRQRIMLARAFVRDPRVVILDEATNALDTLTEHVVTEALDAFGKDRTVVVIAHRLSTVARADHVVVMDEGRVVEEGTFDALVAAGGLLCRMYEIQHLPALRA